jgi:hypothetical protein
MLTRKEVLIIILIVMALAYLFAYLIGLRYGLMATFYPGVISFIILVGTSLVTILVLRRFPKPAQGYC